MKTLVAVVAAFTIAGQAHALSAYSIGAMGGQDPGFAGESAVVSFDGANAVGVKETDSGPAGSVGMFTLTHLNLAAAPMGDTTRFEALQTGGSATFDFSGYAPGVSSLSLYVGSIDSYNKFSISTNLHNYVFNGSNFLNHDGDQSSSFTNRRVFFVLGSGETLKSIELSSTGIAFEYDTLAVAASGGLRVHSLSILLGGEMETLLPASVPEPMSWALMLAGFGAVGVSLRQRRTAFST